MVYEITLQRSPEGDIIAQCPALPGCLARGRNEADARHNIKEAITAWMWDVSRVPANLMRSQAA